MADVSPTDALSQLGLAASKLRLSDLPPEGVQRAKQRVLDKGWSTIGLLGSIGPAVTSGHLLGLDAGRVRNRRRAHRFPRAGSPLDRGPERLCAVHCHFGGCVGQAGQKENDACLRGAGPWGYRACSDLGRQLLGRPLQVAGPALTRSEPATRSNTRSRSRCVAKRCRGYGGTVSSARGSGCAFGCC